MRRAAGAGLLVAAALAAPIGCTRPAAPPPAPAAVPPAAVPPAAVPPAAVPVAPVPEPPDVVVPPRFVDVASEVGIDFTPFNDQDAGHWMIVEIMGSGAGWIDFDLDGWLDLYLTDGCDLTRTRVGDATHRDRLFRGRGAAGFRDVSPAAGILDDRFGQGIAVGDYDVDGFPDIYLSNFQSAALLRNNGDGTFTDTSAAAGIASEGWGSSALFADIDHDGVPDIYACQYLDDEFGAHEPCVYPLGRGYCGPAARYGMQDLVWLGRGDGTFVEAARALGMIEESGNGKGLTVAAVDLDEDLVPEIYVGNDAQPNALYRLAPGPRAAYLDVAPLAGCAVSGDGRSEATMGIAAEDFDGDGRVDLYLTHFALAKNTLYRNLGGLAFEDASTATGVAAATFETLAFGAVAMDWDRDGRMDLFNATGHVMGLPDSPDAMPPQLLRQREDGRFVDVSAAVGEGYFTGVWLGRAAAAADFDEDGDLDLAVTHVGAPVALVRDDTAPPGRFLGLELRTPARLAPIGGRVEVVCGGRTVVRPIAAGGSYLSAHDPRLLVALPAGDDPADVTVHWPGGATARHRLAADAYWRLCEGREPIRCRPAPAAPPTGQSPAVMP